MPMLVGLVREATTSAGCSWKLSGGSQFSSPVTKVSKNRQVCRDSLWRKRRCRCERWTAGGASVRLSHQAIDRRDEPRSQAAVPPAAREVGRSRTMKIDRLDGDRRCDQHGGQAEVPRPRCASLAVFHSSRRLRVKRSRASVRTMASRLTYASYGSKSQREQEPRRLRPGSPDRQPEVRHEREVGRLADQVSQQRQQGNRAEDRQDEGRHATARPWAATAERTRAAAPASPPEPGCGAGCRRSSTRTPRRSDSGRSRAAKRGTRGSSHQAICQSPRIQRCRRLTSAGYREGYSSYSSTSLSRAERAYALSRRSWLRIVFSGKSPQRLREGVHVVDALADERPFAEQILVDVRNDARVGVDARVAREQAHEPGSAGARQADADARLQDAVAVDDAAAGRIEHRPIERVGHRPDHFARRIARQLRVGVERDDVADAGQHGGIADDLRERARATPAQEGVELRQLAALALVAHPHAFAWTFQRRGRWKRKKMSARCAAYF